MAETSRGELVTQNEALREHGKYLLSAQVMEAVEMVIPPTMRKSLTAERCVRAAWQYVLSNPKEMAKCTPRSIAKAVTEAATLGLIVDGIIGQAYVVRFGGEAVLMPGYRGKIALATRGPNVESVNAEAIYKNDRLEAVDLADNRVSGHKPWWLVGATEAGACLGYYAIATLKSGGKILAMIGAEEVEKIHRGVIKRNHGKDTPAWREWPHEQGKKTAIHRLGKRLDLDPSAAAAFNRDEYLLDPKNITPLVPGKIDPNDLSGVIAEKERENKLDGLADRLVVTASADKGGGASAAETGPAVDTKTIDVLKWWIEHAGQEGVDVLADYLSEGDSVPALADVGAWRGANRVAAVRGAIAALATRFPALAEEYQKQTAPAEKEPTKKPARRETRPRRKPAEKDPEPVAEKAEPEEAALTGTVDRFLWWQGTATNHGVNVFAEYDITDQRTGEVLHVRHIDQIQEWDAEQHETLENVMNQLAERFPEDAARLRDALGEE